LTLDALEPRVRVDYGGETGEAWLREPFGDLQDDGLVELDTDSKPISVRFQS